MRIVIIMLLTAVAVGIVMFEVGRATPKNLNKTIVLTTKGIKPSDGDLMRVQYVANDSIYLCIID